jgi:prepilin-type N-terminal cleavage/methylation domain-containing protein
MRKRAGLTIIELMIALVVIGVAFGALLMSQVSSLRASQNARLASDVKAAANRVLEQKMAEVLKVEIDDTHATPAGTTDQITNDNYVDAKNPDVLIFEKTGVWQSFWFTDYYWGCPTVVSSLPSGVRPYATSNKLRSVSCSGSQTSGPIAIEWRVAGNSGILGEGVLDVVVTARHEKGMTVTVGNRVSCYDVYPSPSKSAPTPCPAPYDPAAGSGGGR